MNCSPRRFGPSNVGVGPPTCCSESCGALATASSTRVMNPRLSQCTAPASNHGYLLGCAGSAVLARGYASVTYGTVTQPGSWQPVRRRYAVTSTWGMG